MPADDLRILFVDDSQFDVELEEYELRKGGLAFSSCRVETQPDLVRALGEFKPGLIISDFTLPSMDGLSALDVARKTVPDTPFVFVSGTIGEERAVESLKRGATDYVVKGRIGGLIFAVKRALKETEDREKERQERAALGKETGSDIDKAKKELVLSEARFLAVTRVAGELIYEWQIEDGIVELRGTFEPETDFDTPTSKTKHETWELLLHPEDRPRVLDAVKRHLESGTPFREEYRIVRKDGSVRHWIDRGSLIRDNRAAPRRWIGVVTDVTDLKKVDRMKDELISTVSHELRTPLTAIRGALGLATGGALGEVPTKLKSLLGVAQKNCDRLVRIIDELLDLRRLESGKLQLKNSVTPIVSAVERTVEAYREEAALFGISLRLEAPGADVRALLDPQRLRQALTHFLSNATKFSPKGGTVVVTVAHEGGLVRISVSDQGPGIPEEFRDRIFQRFAQADSSATRVSQGTGLGLSVSKQLVEAMGGSIGFESQAGKGSTFFVEFKIHSP